jgi:hypothetical protein
MRWPASAYGSPVHIPGSTISKLISSAEVKLDGPKRMRRIVNDQQIPANSVIFIRLNLSIVLDGYVATR